MIAEKIGEIESNANKLVQVFCLYSEGQIVLASIKSLEVFDNIKPLLMQRYLGIYCKEVYYRIIGIDNKNSFNLECKEMFHNPPQ